MMSDLLFGLYIFSIYLLPLYIIFLNFAHSSRQTNSLLFFTNKKRIPAISVLLLATILLYYSGGIPLLSANTEIFRIEVFQRFSHLSRAIIVFWQLLLVYLLFIDHHTKYKYLLIGIVLVALLLTGFRSFIVDPLCVYALALFSTSRKISFSKLFLLFVAAISFVVIINYVRWGSIDDFVTVLDTVAYTQTSSVHSVAEFQRLTQINPLIQDLRSLFDSTPSFAELFSHSHGNYVQTASASLYTYAQAFGIPPLFTLACGFLNLFLIRFFAIVSESVAFFYMWTSARSLIVQGPVTSTTVLLIPFIVCILVVLCYNYMLIRSGKQIFKVGSLI